MQQVSFHGIWSLIFGRVFDKCSIFSFITFCIGSGGEVTQETTSDAVSCVASVFVQNTVIYRSVHQHSAVTECFS